MDSSPQLRKEALPNHGVIESADSVTEVVLAAMAGAPNARLREVMAAFVRHLHAFAREVELTEAEYDLAIDFLNRIGQATNDAHNEGILFADAVGFSTLVCLHEQRRRRRHRDRRGPARSVLARQFPADRQWRQHRPLADARPGPVRRLPHHRRRGTTHPRRRG